MILMRQYKRLNLLQVGLLLTGDELSLPDKILLMRLLEPYNFNFELARKVVAEYA